MRDKSKIIDSLMRINPEEGVFSIQDLSVHAIKRYRSIDLRDEEECYRSRRELFNFLLKKIDVYSKKGFPVLFQVVDRESFLLKWADNKSLKVKVSLRRVPTILSELDQLSDRDYEFACKLACEALGARQLHVTSGSGDKSIDFYASIPAYSKSSLFFTGREGLRIVGQSKMYRTQPVAEDEVKILVQSLEGIKHRNPATCAQAPHWFFQSRAPIAGWMVGHSGIQSGGINYAKDHGIVTADGYELAVIISGHREFGYNFDPGSVKDKLVSLIKRMREDNF